MMSRIHLSEPVLMLWFEEESIVLVSINKSKYCSKDIKSEVLSKPVVDLW